MFTTMTYYVDDGAVSQVKMMLLNYFAMVTGIVDVFGYNDVTNGTGPHTWEYLDVTFGNEVVTGLRLPEQVLKILIGPLLLLTEMMMVHGQILHVHTRL